MIENTIQNVLIVLVLYKVTPATCQTLSSLCASVEKCALTVSFKLLIYDNSPTSSLLAKTIPIPVSYVHDRDNGGLAAAYNTAVEMALKEGVHWVLLLDQDTSLTPEYLMAIDEVLPEIGAEIKIAALVPKLRSGLKVVSPTRVLWGGILRPVSADFSGVAPFETSALNSGALIRVSAIQQIGGFDNRFWLDYLDHWMFNRLHHADHAVYVMDTAISHELSVDDFAKMTEHRYRNILTAEALFFRLCKSPMEQKFYLLRLVGRAFKRLLGPGGVKFFRLTLHHMRGVLQQ